MDTDSQSISSTGSIERIERDLDRYAEKRVKELYDQNTADKGLLPKQTTSSSTKSAKNNIPGHLMMSRGQQKLLAAKQQVKLVRDPTIQRVGTDHDQYQSPIELLRNSNRAQTSHSTRNFITRKYQKKHLTDKLTGQTGTTAEKYSDVSTKFPAVRQYSCVS